MALIKCSECGKEISDTANACINCGCPIIPNNIIKTEKKYNNIGLIVGGIITLVISLFLFELGNIVNLDIELILYALLGVACLYISILFFVLWKRKSSKKKINIFVIISTISFLVFSFCCLIYITNWSYIIDVNIGNVEYVKELEVNGVITNEEEKQEETTTKPNTNNNKKPNNSSSNNNNNNTNNNSNNESNTNTTPPPISYNITSISGIGNTYKYRDYNECRVDNLTATVKEIALDDKLQVDYNLTMTKTQKFYDNYDSFCYVMLYAYDSSNVVVGSYTAFIDIGLNETGRTKDWFYIDKSGTNYSIKIKEDN